MTDLKHKNTWSGTHKGVNFEIVQRGVGVEGAYRPQGTWNYYIFVRESMLSPVDFSKIWLEPKSHHEFLNGHKTPYYGYEDIWHDIEFHGGVTSYEKHSDMDVEPSNRWVKVGCDYDHLWDVGMDYSVDEVERDATHSIDILTSMLTFKLRCGWSGKYYLEEEGEWHGEEDGISERVFFSKEGWQSMLDMRARHAAGKTIELNESR